MKTEFIFELGDYVEHKCELTNHHKMIVIERGFIETYSGIEEKYLVSRIEMGHVQRLNLYAEELQKA